LYTKLSIVDIEKVQNQKNQLDFNLLMSIELSIYYLNKHAHRIQNTKKKIC